MENSFYKIPRLQRIAQHGGLAVIGTFLALTAFADTVELTNGRKLDGLVTKETTNVVTLNVGLGEVFLKRAQIKSIHRSSPEQADALRAGWKTQYFTHQNFAPARLSALATRLDALSRKRQAANLAYQSIERHRDEAVHLRDGIKNDEAEWVRMHQKLNDLPKPSTKSPEQLESYNSLVAHGNSLQSAVVLKQQVLTEGQKQSDEDATRVAGYVQELSDVAAELAGLSAESTDETTFLAQARKQVAGYQSELRRVEVPYDDDGASLVLDVEINDEPPGKFILDTGASLVVLSKSFAQRINLEVNTNETVKMTLANGKQEDAHPLILRSVKSGEARALNVPALVTEGAPAPGLDGLLGMSFLRDFVLHFDAHSKRMELVKFESTQ